MSQYTTRILEVRVSTSKGTSYKYENLVERYKDIELTYYDENGKQIIKQVHGFFARLVQHECDHLNGIVFLERVKEKNGFATVENINKYQQPEKFRYKHENEIKQGYVYAFSNMKQEDGEAAAKKDDHSYMTYQANRDGYKYEIVEEGIEDEYNYYIKAKKIK